MGILDRPDADAGKRGKQGQVFSFWICKVSFSPSALFRYLEAFHDPGEERKREQGKAFIPAPNEHLQGLRRANQDFVASIQKRHPEREATLDTDATLVETQKKDAFFSYKGYKAYQPFNVWWAKQKVILHTEFRDGNVLPEYEQLRVFKKALYMIPEGVTKVYVRSDTAGYEHDLLRCTIRVGSNDSLRSRETNGTRRKLGRRTLSKIANEEGFRQHLDDENRRGSSLKAFSR